MITIQGGSDDAVCIEGDVSEEYDCHDKCREGEGIIVAVSDGSLWSVRFGDPASGAGVWRITLISKGSAHYEKFETAADDSDRYTDTVKIYENIKWVAFSDAYALRSRG